MQKIINYFIQYKLILIFLSLEILFFVFGMFVFVAGNHYANKNPSASLGILGVFFLYYFLTFVLIFISIFFMLFYSWYIKKKKKRELSFTQELSRIIIVSLPILIVLFFFVWRGRGD